MNFQIDEIFKLLPHTYPFLLVDRVIECAPQKEIVAIKNVTYNENFFVGHFPGRPVMPGVLILEALAQASGICAIAGAESFPDFAKDLMYFASIEQARFRKPVTPGDVLKLTSSVLQHRRGLYKFSCAAYVGDEVVAEAQLGLMVKSADA